MGAMFSGATLPAVSLTVMIPVWALKGHGSERTRPCHMAKQSVICLVPILF